MVLVHAYFAPLTPPQQSEGRRQIWYLPVEIWNIRMFWCANNHADKLVMEVASPSGKAHQIFSST